MSRPTINLGHQSRAVTAASFESAPFAFISHNSADRAQMERFVAALDAQGCRYWVSREIPGGENWLRCIENAITSCRVVIALISCNSSKSQWVEIEIAKAMELGLDIVPVVLGECPLPFALTTKQKFSWPSAYAENPDSAADELAALVRQLCKSRPNIVQTSLPAVPETTRGAGRAVHHVSRHRPIGADYVVSRRRPPPIPKPEEGFNVRAGVIWCLIGIAIGLAAIAVLYALH